jgi:hypothetical protein
MSFSFWAVINFARSALMNISVPLVVGIGRAAGRAKPATSLVPIERRAATGWQRNQEQEQQQRQQKVNVFLIDSV